jgi:hypothetical protein
MRVAFHEEITPYLPLAPLGYQKKYHLFVQNITRMCDRIHLDAG